MYQELACRLVNHFKKSKTTKDEENIQPLKEETINQKYSIQISDFEHYFLNLEHNNNAGLREEYRVLINESMDKKEKHHLLFNMAETLSRFDFEDQNHVIQVNDVRITVSKASFSNSKLDAVFIPKKEDPTLMEYIVSQNPLDNCINDFLQMIWEQDVNCIIVLTRLNKQRANIFSYWSDKEGTTRFKSNENTFEVNTRKITMFGNLTERLLDITKNSKDHKSITQLHLMTPLNDEEPILNVYENLFNRLNEMKSFVNCCPILLHSDISNLDQCSVVICIDKIISKLCKGFLEINIYNTMLEINQYRNLLLQQETQYLCVYEYINWLVKRSIKINV